MDFSSLDLLASTALRDNNPTQGDNSTTPAEHHPQQNHHDSVENDEDDDDEADGNRDCVEQLESVAAEDSVEKEMGSVKCGKHKKNSAKPTSIFVRDKKCVAQHLPADKTCPKETKGEVTGDSNGTHPPLEVNCTEQGGNADSQNTIVHCNMTPKCPTQTEEKNSAPESSAQPCCNGVNKINHRNTLPADDEIQQAELCLTDVSTDSQLSNVRTDQTSCDLKDRLCEKASQEQAPLEHALDSNSKETSKSLTERDSDAVNTSVADLSRESSQLPSVAAESCGSKELFGSEQAEKQQEGTGCCGTGVLHTDRQSPVMTESILESGTQSDSATSELINFTVPDGTGVEKSTCSDSVETAMETKTPQICDENLAVVTCSQTEVKVGEQSGPCKISVDQETGSSGTKELEPSISSKTENVKSMLSPPPPVLPPPPINSQAALADHTYYSRYKGRILENMDDSCDAFESADENISADETERRPRSLSVDSVYLQYNVAGLSSQQESSQNDRLALLSPTLSVDSISNDSSVSEHSTPAGGQCYSILVGSPNPKGTNNRLSLAIVDSQITGAEKSVSSDGDCRMGPSVLEAGGSSSQVDISNFMAGGPKCGKFRIGTYGSFSNSHLELEKESKKSKLKNGLSDPPIKTPLPSLVMPSPGSPFPLLQSPGMEWDRSDAGSEAPDDLDSSTTEDKFLSSSHDSDTFNMTVSQVWRHPVFHDHDYCSKEVSEEYLGKPAPPAPQMKAGKRKYVKKKDRQDYEEEKLRKGKYLKRELLKQDNRFNLGGGRGMDSRIVAAKSSLLAEPFATKPNPVGRPRKRTEKQLEEYDAETGAKMKITGKYQDQYVYYLNKSSRNRRRKVDEKISSGDKIILPAPKPGDIVVPHLSDADCEAIRQGGRNALYNNNSQPASSVPLPHTDSGDMDSSIVNTILSMETEHGNLHSPLNAYDGVGSHEDFRDIEDNLTSEQVKLLIDCLEDCQMEETTTSQELDLLTCAESVCVPSTTIDSLAGTSGEEDLMVPGVTPPLSSSAVTEPTTQLEKIDPSSPAQVNLEQEGLTCNIKTEVMEHSDMKPLVTGMPVPPPTSQPSVEKNLEFLKTPFFPESSVASPGSHELFSPPLPTSLMSPMPDSKSDDVNETPWIVTVTLYWNDIPAIVINNVPHVRLVDIHRQILPAKDTGILKKRCQLMSIQVSNCTEMQRYFLVQYGRAHNSKSTLVISKDEAQRLITYYAHPPPRNLRGEDGAGFRRSSSYAELRSIMERPSNPGRHSTLAFNQPRKRGGFRRRALPARSHNPSPSPEPPAPTTPPVDPLLTSPQPAAPTPSVKGLRHKKINFREMLRGEDSSSQLSPLIDAVTEDSALAEELPAVKGRTSKPSAAAGGKRRRGPKDVGGGTPAKRGRKACRKKNEGKDGAQQVPGKQQETDIVVDKDSPGTGVGTKTKKRSPGSAAGGNLSASSRSPKSKYGLIKVNVKSLVSSGGSLFADGSQPRKKNLFGRKSSSADVVDGSGVAVVPCKPARVLRISHQDVEATSLPVSPTPSPTAEVHLDLYKQACSPCVKCRICQEFLSVADFLKHQHVSGVDMVKGSTVHTNLARSHPRRILVPLNKENISLEEQRLWNEFVALQESLDCTIGVASMGAYPLTPLSPASPIGSSLNTFGDAHSLAVDELHLMTPESPYPASASNGRDGDDTVMNSEAVAPSVTVMAENHVASPSSAELPTASDPLNTTDVSLSAEGAKCAWDSELLSSPLAPPFPTTHTQNEEKCFVNNSGKPEDKEVQSRPKTVSSSNKKQWPLQRPRKTPVTSVRTSSRKRETKRLYSFEKYEFAVGGKKGGRGETDTQDMEDDLRDTLLDVNSVAASGTILHLASATTLVHKPQNN